MILATTRPRLALSSSPPPEGPGLALGRAHEVAGPGRRVLAALAAGRLAGPLLWIRAAPAEGRLNPEGLAPLLDPCRLVVLRDLRAPEALWAAEEALRSGACPCVVLEAAVPPALTPVRRLNLAAEAGAAQAPTAPLCLLLLAEGGAAGAVETRWWVDPLPGWAAGGVPRWRLSLLRDKGGPPGVWEMAEPGAASLRRPLPLAPWPASA
jgi:protein ImuA